MIEDASTELPGRYVCFIADRHPDWQPVEASERGSMPAPAAVAVAPIPEGSSLLAEIRWHTHSAAAVVLASTTLAARVFGLQMKAAQNACMRGLLAAMEWDEAWGAWGVPIQERGIIGTACVDTLGYHVASDFSDGKWSRRENVAYISNMAVAPGCRRCVPCHRLLPAHAASFVVRMTALPVCRQRDGLERDGTVLQPCAGEHPCRK